MTVSFFVRNVVKTPCEPDPERKRVAFSVRIPGGPVIGYQRGRCG